MSKASFEKTLRDLPSESLLTINLNEALMIDFEVKKVIEEFLENAKLKNIQIKILQEKIKHLID